MKSRKANPMTRLGWHQHYANRFNKTGDESSAHLACWYLMLHLELGS